MRPHARHIIFRWSARVLLSSLALFLVGLLAGRFTLAAWSVAVALAAFAAVVLTGIRSNKDYLRSHGEDL